MASRSTNWMTCLKLVHLEWPKLLHHQFTRPWDGLEPVSILHSQFDEINQHGPSSRNRWMDVTMNEPWRNPAKLPSHLKTSWRNKSDWLTTMCRSARRHQTSPSVSADISEPRLISPPSSFFSPSMVLLLNKCQYKTSRQMRPETLSPSPWTLQHVQWMRPVHCSSTRQQTHAWLISLVFKNNTLFFLSSSA